MFFGKIYHCSTFRNVFHKIFHTVSQCSAQKLDICSDGWGRLSGKPDVKSTGAVLVIIISSVIWSPRRSYCGWSRQFSMIWQLMKSRWPFWIIALRGNSALFLTKLRTHTSTVHFKVLHLSLQLQCTFNVCNSLIVKNLCVWRRLTFLFCFWSGGCKLTSPSRFTKVQCEPTGSDRLAYCVSQSSTSQDNMSLSIIMSLS